MQILRNSRKMLDKTRLAYTIQKRHEYKSIKNNFKQIVNIHLIPNHN